MGIVPKKRYDGGIAIRSHHGIAVHIVSIEN